MAGGLNSWNEILSISSTVPVQLYWDDVGILLILLVVFLMLLAIPMSACILHQTLSSRPSQDLPSQAPEL